MATDPITIEVIANALKSIVYEMDAAIERTSMSIIIREQHDFGMSLVDHRGWVVAGTTFAGQTLAEYAATHPVEPGDVVMFNDPYLSHGEISHLGDTMLAVPIFWNSRLIAWGIAWGHHMDIGADAPAAMPTQATEIFHEGLQIPPVKLYDRGVLNQGVLDIVARNSRTPEMMVGDTLALSAAGKIAEKRLQELCTKFGGEVVLETFQVLFDRAYDTMLKLIHQLPDHQPVSFSDVLDSDGLNDELLTIRMTVERQGDHVILDFAGTSPQCEGPMNLPLNEGLQKLRFYNVMRLAAGARINIDPALDANQGVEDLIEVRIPEGCFLAPTYPAPVSLRHLTGGRIGEVTQGILAQIFPDTIPATANGSLNSYSLLGVGRKPEDRWLCFEVTAAGGGGRPFGDGVDAFCFNHRLKNAPVEFVETVYPVRIEQYSLRPGSAGAGKHRGGYGLIRAIRSLKPAKLTFLDERQRTQPWGLRGGRAAAANDAYVERADGRIVMLPGKFDHLPIAPGDMFVMRTGGGGGWGDPVERDPELVRLDVERRLLTPDQAREVYGVAIEGWPPRIDAAATAVLRAQMPARSNWIDRGVSVASPGPGEYREMSKPPEPWLVIGQSTSVRSVAADD
ncbi:MAG TPA: hydantoinase B/oxoprolinase family protein [Nitrolancea sp.]|nr:hydantoinase B/oxoprolinase family protein [Nitrolancea sp.]